MDLLDPQRFSAQLQLRYVADTDPGITRVRRGRGFSFHGPDGRLLSGQARDRCVRLAVPPAWREVWICPDDDGHLQATGIDDAERRQYRYHDRWTEGRRLANFDRLLGIGERLADVRRELDGVLGDELDPVRRATAAMVRLVDAGTARIGGIRSAREFGHFGVSTLRAEHVAVDGDHITLLYPGKSGVERHVEVDDPLLADVLAHLEVASEQVFEIRDGDRTHRLSAVDANELLAELSGGALTCKDFRTWGGSAVALQARTDGADEVAAVDAAAAALGNTRAVARSSYVHPDVGGAPAEEVADVWRASRASTRYDRRERALLKLLEQRPPLLDRWMRDDAVSGS
ncbi:DNA topoisomerase IB [Euzebya sp.]|uniref:DNA topoisomerase IB n=1 Tax=Euzebya sp. TaxID=1971409 RepID=UPI0035177BAA